MKNPFKHSSRDAMPRESENTKKEIRVFYEDPVVFGKVPEPAEETPTPPANSAGTPMVLIGGLLVALLCLWWFAPEWLAATWKHLVTQIFHFVGR
jgi:hypothetical protein